MSPITLRSEGTYRAVALGGGFERHIGPSPGYIPLHGVQEITDPITGKTLTVSRSATYDLMYRRQPAFYAVATLLIKAFARLPAKTYIETADSRARSKSAPTAKLLRTPYRRGSAWDWKVRLGYDLMVHGRHLQVKYRPNPASPPTGLIPVPWSRVERVEDDLGLLGFFVHMGSERIPVPLDDAVYYELPGGVAPSEVLRRTLALEDAATTFQGSALENGVTPRAAFSFKNPIMPQDRPFVRGEIEKLYMGPDKAANFAILSGDATVSTIGVSAVDLALMEQRKLSREECCAVYNVSPAIVGWGSDKAISYASAKEFHGSLYVDALGPVITMVEETMQAQLIDVEGAWDGLYVEFDLDELLRPDMTERMRAYLLGQQSSTFTIDDRRAAENKPAFKIAGVTDVPLIPVNMRPAAAGMFDNGEPPPVPGDPGASGLIDQLVLDTVRGGSRPDPEEGGL